MSLFCFSFFLMSLVFLFLDIELITYFLLLLFFKSEIRASLPRFYDGKYYGYWLKYALPIKFIARTAIILLSRFFLLYSIKGFSISNSVYMFI